MARTEGDIAYFAVGTGEYSELTRGHPFVPLPVHSFWTVCFANAHEADCSA